MNTSTEAMTIDTAAVRAFFDSLAPAWDSGRITREDIEAVATPELSAVVFRIAEAIGEKNYDKAAKVLG